MADFVIILTGGAGAFFYWPDRSPNVDWQAYSLVVLLGAVLSFNLLQIAGAYEFTKLANLSESLNRVFAGWLAVGATLIVISFLTKISAEYSRRWSLLWFAGVLALLSTARIAIYLSIVRWRQSGALCRVVAVVGAGPIGQGVLRHLNCRPDPGLRITGVYDDRVARMPSRCMGYPINGDLDRLLEDARDGRVDTIIVALPLSADRRLAGIVAKLRVLPVDLRLCPDQFGLQMPASSASHINGLTLLDICDKPLSGWRSIGKELEDGLFAAAILLLVAPVMLLIAIAIKLDSPGPILFRQMRYGFNNQLISVFKFRTMYYQLEDRNAEQLTRRDDPRVTRVGAFLRRTSLDELPQLFNVFRGEMSIVGPRPHATAAKAGGLLYQDAVREYAARHRVKPGITGWAQVNGWRGETETVEQIERRVEHDLFYIEHWSLILDLRIIVLTILGGFTGRHAY